MRTHVEEPHGIGEETEPPRDEAACLPSKEESLYSNPGLAGCQARPYPKTSSAASCRISQWHQHQGRSLGQAGRRRGLVLCRAVMVTKL